MFDLLVVTNNSWIIKSRGKALLPWKPGGLTVLIRSEVVAWFFELISKGFFTNNPFISNECGYCASIKFLIRTYPCV